MQRILEYDGMLEVSRSIPAGFVGYAKTLPMAAEEAARDSQREGARIPCAYVINQVVNGQWETVATMEVVRKAIPLADDGDDE